MLERCRDPKEALLPGVAAAGGEPSFESDDFADWASISLRNCSLFMAAS